MYGRREIGTGTFGEVEPSNITITPIEKNVQKTKNNWKNLFCSLERPFHSPGRKRSRMNVPANESLQNMNQGIKNEAAND